MLANSPGGANLNFNLSLLSSRQRAGHQQVHGRPQQAFTIEIEPDNEAKSACAERRMKKTLLLVFIHGFKGDDDTFGNFPAHLRALLSHALPKIDVVAVTYPKFESRGDLTDCVARFREWLQNQVIDIEVANQTASPTVDPSVHVALVGHSMGGIIAAETLILLASEQLIPPPSHLSPSKSEDNTQGLEEKSFMFPHIQGLLALDTPFLGIAPGVVSYAAENHHKTATAAYGTLADVANIFGWRADGKDPRSGGQNGGSKAKSTPHLSKPGESDTTSSSEDAAATPSWQRWGRYAMFAGAAGAVAAGGAAALYTQRDRFSAGWNWATSHLEFVGCLARFEDLRRRLHAVSRLQQERGIGCANLYTCLGKGAVNVSTTDSTSMNATAGAASFSRLRSDMRTFCSLPEDVESNSSPDHKMPPDSDNAKESEEAGRANGVTQMAWIKSVNSKAADETKAHLSMFMPTDNPEFYELAQTARNLVAEWVDKGWYETSGEGFPGGSPSVQDEDKPDRETADADDIVVLS